MGGSNKPGRGGRGDEREQWFLLYAGLSGAALLTAGLWIMRSWIAGASMLELIAGIMMLVGAGAVVSVITAFFLFATRVDRTSEDISRALDGIAAGSLTSHVHAPRGLGREARLAGAAAAALARLRAWVESSHAALTEVEKDVDATRTPLPQLREAVSATAGHVGQLSRDTQFLAAAADEHGALTQRACVLAAVIGQSQRDTTAFAERVHASVRDAAASLAECAKRTTELRTLVSRQTEDSTRCVEADRHLTEYLVVVNKSARQFKLLALHAAMEAARAGARSEVQGASGSEFRVVALEVRRLAVELAKITDDIGRTMEGARRSLLALHTAATEGERHAEAAQASVSLGIAALDHAAATTTGRIADDATLAEAGTELTILTSAIRERSTGAAKGAGDVADRIAALDQSLAAAETAALDIEQALATVAGTLTRARETVGTMSLKSPESRVPSMPVVSSHAKRARRKKGEGRPPAVLPTVARSLGGGA